MSELATLALLVFAASAAWLVGLALFAVLYLLPRPRRFGFEVKEDRHDN